MIRSIKIIVGFLMFISTINLQAQSLDSIPDRVILKDGTEVKGQIIDVQNDRITIETEWDIPYTIELARILKYYQNDNDQNTFVWINEDPLLPMGVEPAQSKLSTFRDKKFATELGINIGTLISQFVPLGRSTTATGPYNLTFRIGKDKNYFHFQLGFDASNEPFSDDVDHFNIAIGYMRKTKISDKFNYYKAFDIMAFSGSFNDPTSTSSNSFNDGVGIGIGFGIEYMLYKNIYLGTETILYIGSPTPDIIPPAALYLIARIER